MTHEHYHLANVRELLLKGFSEEELRAVCFDVPDFRPVYDQLARNTGKTEIVAKLLEHAEKTLQIDILLALAKDRNPARYKKHQPYYKSDPTSALQKQVADLARRLSATQTDPETIMGIAEAKAFALDRIYTLRLNYFKDMIQMLKEEGLSEETIKTILQDLISSNSMEDKQDIIS